MATAGVWQYCELPWNGILPTWLWFSAMIQWLQAGILPTSLPAENWSPHCKHCQSISISNFVYLHGSRNCAYPPGNGRREKNSLFFQERTKLSAAMLPPKRNTGHVFSEEFKEIASFHCPALLFLPSPTRNLIIRRQEIPISFYLCLPNCAETLPTSWVEQGNSQSCCLHSPLQIFFWPLPCTRASTAVLPAVSTEPSELCSMDACTQAPVRHNPYTLLPALTLK